MNQMNLFSSDDSVVELYKSHNKKYITDSGLDLIIPENIVIEPLTKFMIDHKISCSCNYEGGYFLFPRSSLATKTPLILSNSVGIIDKNYRGNIKAVVYNTSTTSFGIDKGISLFQLCMPDLKPFEFKFVSSLDETDRGTGCFGSTNTK